MFKRIISIMCVCALLLGYLFVPINLVVDSYDAGFPAEKGNSKIRYYYVDHDLDCVVETENENEFRDDLEQRDKVDVLFELSYHNSCTCRDEITKDSTIDEIERARLTHRNEMKAVFSSMNAEFIEQNDIDFDSDEYNITVAEYAPYIMMSFENYEEYIDYEEQIISLADDTTVCSVSVSESVESFPYATRVDSSIASTYDIVDAMDDIGALSPTYEGEGVKVGIIEAKGVAYSNSHEELENLNIRTNKPAGTTTTANEHAINVTRILCGSYGVAPGVEDVYIYHSNYNTSMVNAMEWMVDNDVNVVNISKGTPGIQGEYHWTSAVLDFYVRTYFLSCVASAGNKGRDTQHQVSNYGMGENVIAVAGTDASNNISSYSSYGVNTEVNLRKPTISAPGTNIVIAGEDLGSGTSYAAPMVAGVIAKLMEEEPFLMMYPEAMMACLIASATPVNGQGNAWDIHAGAGRISYERAREAVDNLIVFTNRNDAVNSIVKTKRISVATNKRIIVATVWLANSETDSLIDDPVLNNHTNYDLHLESVSGAYSVYDNNRSTNTEYLSVYNTSYTMFNINILQKSAIRTGEEDVGAFTWIIE